MLIREIVNQSLTLGYLSVEAEEQLRTNLSHKYDVEDFRAFMQLQFAIMNGQVKQEARERFLVGVIH
ncbi:MULTISPECIES: hypothetical protein [Roseofilum]|uniref:Uncharacterized protein n=1 Tax=Roseofilum reptotaenium AO1-A TaxID=1925591 RepID=A0A1L9QMN8_9CYAN|nr:MULTISPECIES: hypothetical protein [Roseofilum]OJJ22703.1 hypothetical protein BI308_19295 [Roseofilum reptotaenium AO1-A]HBR00363.1 hypothetical protein [Cyanobacteria bacterium UBA11691]MBP0010764.1 hypothetical protein [Roseofilum sp. Belize Diploria]MBP0015659.1 hypothetical protein [Roseofilum sp. SID3]MBP0022574.1 hypothetical protein [Roseofilum sp. SID2]